MSSHTFLFFLSFSHINSFQISFVLGAKIEWRHNFSLLLWSFVFREYSHSLLSIYIYCAGGTGTMSTWNDEHGTMSTERWARGTMSTERWAQGTMSTRMMSTGKLSANEKMFSLIFVKRSIKIFINKIIYSFEWNRLLCLIEL